MDEEASQTLAILVAELIAIERWDEHYWRNGPPDVDEIVAYVSRKERRSEIIRLLADITRKMERNKKRHPGPASFYSH
jgi:hypothetical protein